MTAYPTLTPTMRRVLDMTADGFRTRDIAKRAGISPRTVQNVRAEAKRRLGIPATIGVGANTGLRPTLTTLRDEHIRTLTATINDLCMSAEGLLLSGDCIGPVGRVVELAALVREARSIIADKA